MRAVRVRSVVPLVVAISLLALACASPPEAEKKAADAAVSAAGTAGAEKYAPSEFSAMTAAVKKAEAEMSNKAYKEAKASYESVKDLADRAAKAAVAGKAAADAAKAAAESSWPISRPAGRSSRRRLKSPPRASRPTRRRSGTPTVTASARRSPPPRPQSPPTRPRPRPSLRNPRSPRQVGGRRRGPRRTEEGRQEARGEEVSARRSSPLPRERPAGPAGPATTSGDRPPSAARFGPRDRRPPRLGVRFTSTVSARLAEDLDERPNREGVSHEHERARTAPATPSPSTRQAGREHSPPCPDRGPTTSPQGRQPSGRPRPCSGTRARTRPVHAHAAVRKASPSALACSALVHPIRASCNRRLGAGGNRPPARR